MATDFSSYQRLIDRYEAIFQRSGIFEQVPRERYKNALSCLNATKVAYPAGEMLKWQGEQSKRAGIVLSGTLEEYLYDESGNQVTIDRLGEGSVFGAEILCAAQLTSQVYLCAATDCEVLLLEFGKLLTEETFGCPCRMQVSANLMKKLAGQVVFLSTRIRILSQKKLRGKLKIYLQTQPISEKGEITLSINREKMAELLCVDRSALSRELSRMRDEGILSWAGKTITIHEPDFLEN